MVISYECPCCDWRGEEPDVHPGILADEYFIVCPRCGNYGPDKVFTTEGVNNNVA